MFKDVEELKQFVIWARDQKIQQVKVGEVEVTFSALALLSDEDTRKLTIPLSGIPAQSDLERMKKEEEDLLYHSS